MASLKVLLVLLLFFTPGSRSGAGANEVNLKVTVQNGADSREYTSKIPMGAVLRGALIRLQEEDDFSFTESDNKDFGWFLESVNGIPGDFTERTFWQLLRKESCTYIPLDVGFGCYVPEDGDDILLKFSSF